MKEFISILFTISCLTLFGQKDTLRLPDKLSELVPGKTKIKEAINLLGKPDKYKESSMHVNYSDIDDVWVYKSHLYYEQYDCELFFSAENSRRKRNKELGSITFNSESLVLFNDSIQISKSDTTSILKTFGKPNYYSKDEKSGNKILAYLWENNETVGQRTKVLFWFDEKGILTQVDIE